MRKSTILGIAMSAVGLMNCCATAATINETYTAEGLTTGSSIIAPQQDGWTIYSGGGGATPETVIHPVNGSTTVLRASSGIQLSRINDGAFSYLPHTDGGTGELIFDAHYNAASDLVFGLGRNLASNNNTNLGPVFGMASGGWFIRQAVYGANTSTALSGGDGVGDWYRIKLFIDFAGYSGDGAADMFVMNLSDGETDFRPSPIFTGFNLGINSMTALAQDPASWNSIYVRLGTGNEADNLNPNFVFIPPPPVPEPSTAVLLLLGCVSLRRFGRKNSQRHANMSKG